MLFTLLFLYIFQTTQKRQKSQQERQRPTNNQKKPKHNNFFIRNSNIIFIIINLYIKINIIIKWNIISNNNYQFTIITAIQTSNLDKSPRDVQKPQINDYIKNNIMLTCLITT